VSLIGGQGAAVPAPVRLARGVGGGGSTSVWLARIVSSHLAASLDCLRCLLSFALSARWRFSSIIISCDGRYSLPHPLIRFFQISPTYRLSDPSRLRRAAPSVPLNGQSNPTPLSLPTPDQSCKSTPPTSKNYLLLAHIHTYNVPESYPKMAQCLLLDASTLLPIAALVSQTASQLIYNYPDGTVAHLDFSLSATHGTVHHVGVPPEHRSSKGGAPIGKALVSVFINLCLSSSLTLVPECTYVSYILQKLPSHSIAQAGLSIEW